MLRISVCVGAFFLLACCLLPVASRPPAASGNAVSSPAAVTSDLVGQESVPPPIGLTDDGP
jgi:hypothetical protein